MSSKIRMTGLVSGLDTESIVKELMSAQRMKLTKIENKKTELEWKRDKWKELNTKVYSFYTGSLAKMKMEGTYNVNKASSSNEAKVTATASVSAPEGTHTISVSKVASAEYITSDKINKDPNNNNKLYDYTYDYTTKLYGTANSATSLGMNENDIKITVGSNNPVIFDVTQKSTIADFVNALQSAGLNASFDRTQQRFFISAKESGAASAFSIESASPSNAVDFSKLGLDEIKADATGKVSVPNSNPNVKVSTKDASDAKIIYNNAEITSSSNNIAVNGLTINVKDVTTEDVNITVSRDTQTIYDSIKSMLKSYNEVLKELNTDYDAEVAKGYEPLTDDQKQSMSDTQVEKWENKIKDSLLRRDDTVNSIISGMREIADQSITVNGKKYALSSFGITSTIYTEEGQLHIDGDKDDTLSSANDDKLMKAITENPEAVTEVFTTVAKKLYTKMSDQMKSTTLKSALTFYNDKEMKKQITDYEDQMDDMEDKLDDLEDRYYKQFSAMETAMANMKSQQSSISSLLGTSSS